jgi:hypothetical protein
MSNGPLRIDGLRDRSPLSVIFEFNFFHRDLITMLDDLRARGVKFDSLTEATSAFTLAIWPRL